MDLPNSVWCKGERNKGETVGGGTRRWEVTPMRRGKLATRTNYCGRHSSNSQASTQREVRGTKRPTGTTTDKGKEEGGAGIWEAVRFRGPLRRKIRNTNANVAIVDPCICKTTFLAREGILVCTFTVFVQHQWKFPKCMLE